MSTRPGLAYGVVPVAAYPVSGVTSLNWEPPLQYRSGGPMFCTETLAHGEGSTFKLVIGASVGGTTAEARRWGHAREGRLHL
jgi:hypothetical protein